MPEEARKRDGELVGLSERFAGGDYPKGADRKQIVGWSGVPDGVHRLWGPPIFKQTIQPAVIDALNTLIDNHLADAAVLRQRNHAESLVGDVHTEFRLAVDEASNAGLMGPLGLAVAQFVGATWKPGDINGRGNVKLRNLTLWCVISRQHDFNPPHSHNGDVSGVLWLKNPDKMVESTKKWWGGLFSFCHSGESKWETSVRTFYPTVGTLVLFPSYLTHVVTPFDCPGERRSLSFNAEIALEGT